MEMDKTNQGLALAFGSALSFTLLNTGVRYSLDNLALSAWGILLFRGICSLLVAVLLARHFRLKLINRGGAVFCAAGFFNFLSSICITVGISLLPLYQVLVLLYLYPSMTVPLAYFINGQRAGRRAIFLVSLAFIGCLILLWPDDKAGLTLRPAHLIALAGALVYALSYVLANRADSSNNAFQPVFYYGCWAIAGNLLIIFILGAGPGLEAGRNIPAALGLGLLAVSALFMGYAALRRIPAFKVGIIGSLEVLGGVLASWLLFDDPITLRTLSGGLIILAAALLLRKS